MSDMESLLKSIAKIDAEIETLKERIVGKQNERQEILDSARAVLDTFKRTAPTTSNGVRGPKKGTPNHKQRSLTDDQVREMRAKWATGQFSQRELGEQYGGLAQPVVSSIVHHHTYQDVV